jgi:gluconokinase
MIHNHSAAPCPPIVVMGVSGCGKSSLGAALAQVLGLAYLEGDDFHTPECRERMRAGTPLTDADREGWLQRLAAGIVSHHGRAAASCSALKRRYRDQLRAGVPGLRFVYLHATPELAATRVRSRGAAHYFPASLVQSQFEALEPPEGEPDVLRLDAGETLSQSLDRACAWLAAQHSL